MPDHHYYVYILASTHKHLYIGVTNDLTRRTEQHKSKANPASFTAKYNIDQLVHFEHFTNIQQAITREKELKKWNRLKKIALIVSQNPTWQDLSEECGKPVAPFNEADQKPPTTF